MYNKKEVSLNSNAKDASKRDTNTIENSNIRCIYKVNNLRSINSEIAKKEKNKEKMKEIIAIIEKRPNLLGTLSENKLQIIDNYYIEQIEEYERKIKKYSVS